MILKGTFKREIFRSDTGYVIGLFKIKEIEKDQELPDNITNTITFTGYFHELTIDDNYSLTGKFVEHDKYGIQFQVESYERILPEEKEGIIEFLSGGLFKGIGEKTAKKIVDKLGKDTLNIILENPSNLYLIPSITKKQVDTLHNTLLEYQESYETIVYLNDLGFSTRDSLIIYNNYKANTKRVLEDNIYLIYEDNLDIGFKKVDDIALKNNYSLDDIRRIEATILYVINEVCYTYGHSYLFNNEIYNYTIRCLKIDIGLELFEKAMNNLMLDVRIIRRNEKFYLRNMYEAEENITKRCGYLMRTNDNINKKLDNIINEVEKVHNCFYNDKQKEAIRNSFIKNLLIVTGGPGTGKTTIIKGIVDLYQTINKLSYGDLCKKIALLAPTGRASKRLSSATNLPASTIHRFLKWNKDKDTFQVNEYHKSDVEFVIVDEFSMVDTLLFDSLLRGLKYDTKIILVGDSNQLPSVGSGELLKDMIESNALNVVKLTELYRQEENSNIINLAYQINEDNLDYDTLAGSSDVEFYNLDRSKVMDKIKEIASNYIDNDNFQILAPMYKTLNGIDKINNNLQNIYNPKDKSKKEIIINNVLYRENDKVIQLSNMPDDNVFNGDIGYIVEINNSSKKEVIISFDGNEVKYTPSNFNKFALAYAISIHKSQGSEFDYVLIPILKEYGKMLYRKLIYTGVTRAKKKLYLIGDTEALELAIKNNNSDIRQTTLKDMLIENILNV